MKCVMYLIIFSLVISSVSAGMLSDVFAQNSNMKNLCVDTDANKDRPEFKRGYVQDMDGIYWDQCVNSEGGGLIERICVDGHMENKIYKCERGCYAGSCVKYSWFKLPSTGYLPFSKNFLSLKRLISSEPPNKAKYDFDIFNLAGLKDFLQDIDKRLSAIEEQMGILEREELIVRLNKVESFTNSDVLDIAYYKLDENLNVVEEAGSAQADLEMFVKVKAYNDVKILFASDSVNGIGDYNDDLNMIALNDDGKVLMEKILGVGHL